jgi:hypothetical protein
MVRASAYFEPIAQLGNRRSVPMIPKLSRVPRGAAFEATVMAATTVEGVGEARAAPDAS